MAQRQVQQAGARPQPNVYTVMLLVAIIVLLTTIVLSLTHLMSGYGMSFGDLFEPLGGAGAGL